MDGPRRIYKLAGDLTRNGLWRSTEATFDGKDLIQCVHPARNGEHFTGRFLPALRALFFLVLAEAGGGRHSMTPGNRVTTLRSMVAMWFFPVHLAERRTQVGGATIFIRAVMQGPLPGKEKTLHNWVLVLIHLGDLRVAKAFRTSPVSHPTPEVAAARTSATEETEVPIIAQKARAVRALDLVVVAATRCRRLKEVVVGQAVKPCLYCTQGRLSRVRSSA